MTCLFLHLYSCGRDSPGGRGGGRGDQLREPPHRLPGPEGLPPRLPRQKDAHLGGQAHLQGVHQGAKEAAGEQAGTKLKYCFCLAFFMSVLAHAFFLVKSMNLGWELATTLVLSIGT